MGKGGKSGEGPQRVRRRRRLRRRVFGLLEQIKELNMNIKFNVGGERAPMMAVDRVTFGYLPDESGREQPILSRDVDFLTLNMDSRVALVGRTARGADALKLMLQEVMASNGGGDPADCVVIGENLPWVRSAGEGRGAVRREAHVDGLPEHPVPADWVPAGAQHARPLASRATHRECDIHTLPGGQKSRVVCVELTHTHTCCCSTSRRTTSTWRRSTAW